MALLPLTLAAILSLLCIPFVCALPLNCTSVPTLDISDSPSSSSHTRTLCDIIQSCAATLFACSWAAIHPNIPGMYEGRMVIFFRRLSIMVMALIAPELMVTWATMQYLSALETADTFKKLHPALHPARSNRATEDTAMLPAEATSDQTNSPHPSAPRVASRAFKEWTVTHGFFAWMGGFMLYCNDEPRATLTPEELKRYVNEGSVKMPVIVEAELEALSKSDALSKGIAILQLAWFVLQLVARYIQNLPTTLLEIDTLAVVSLACISYCLWWKKPKDVRRPCPVYWKGNNAGPPSQSLTYEKKHAEFSFSGWDHYLMFVIYPLRSLMGTHVAISPRAVQRKRIPAFGGYDDHDPHDRNHKITLFVGCFSAIIFGGMHCLGWYYLFQGHTEQILWRVTSLVTVSASLPLLLIFGGVMLFHIHPDSSVVRWSVATIACIYIAARITVIVVIVSSLQSLPAGAYDVVAWTTFVPHV